MTIFAGNICKNAVTRKVAVGEEKTETTVTTFTVAENYSIGGNERTRYHQIEGWGERWDKLAQYLYAGRPLYVEGAEDARAWMGKDNKIYATLVMRNPHIKFLTANRANEDPTVVPEVPEDAVPDNPWEQVG